MKYVDININFGGFIGADNSYIVEVPDEATKDEIDDICQDFFEEKIREECEWEIISYDDDEDDEDDEDM